MPIKTRMDYEVELMAEKIPGCQGVYEDIGPHLIHVSKWLINNLIDARIKIDELTDHKCLSCDHEECSECPAFVPRRSVEELERVREALKNVIACLENSDFSRILLWKVFQQARALLRQPGEWNRYCSSSRSSRTPKQ